MTKPKILKVRKYIHDKYHVFFACVRGELLYSQTPLKAHEVADVVSTFSGLDCFTFSDGQTFCYSQFAKAEVLNETSTNII